MNPEHDDALTELSSHLQMLKAQNKLRELGPVIDLYSNMVNIMDAQAETIRRLEARVTELESDSD